MSLWVNLLRWSFSSRIRWLNNYHIASSAFAVAVPEYDKAIDC